MTDADTHEVAVAMEAGQKIHMLVLENNLVEAPSIQLLLRDMMKVYEALPDYIEAPYYFEIVSSYDQALIRAGEADWDVILSDYTLADGRSGADFARSLLAANVSAPIVLISDLKATKLPQDDQELLFRHEFSLITEDELNCERLMEILDVEFGILA